jgi:hypothetical protein
MALHVPVLRKPLKVPLTPKQLADLQLISALFYEKHKAAFEAAGEPPPTPQQVVDDLLEEAIPRRLAALQRGGQTASERADRSAKSLDGSAGFSGNDRARKPRSGHASDQHQFHSAEPAPG